MGWLIALAVIVALGCIPVGVHVRYDESGFLLRVVASFLRFTVIPFPKRKKTKKKTTEKPQSAPKKSDSEKVQTAKPAQSRGGNLMDFLPLVKIGLDFLNAFRRRLRVNHLLVKLILAGDDPCDVAVSYGRAWEAIGNLLPVLERVLNIGQRDIEVACDFESAQTTVLFNMEITTTIGRMLFLGTVYGIRVVKELLKIKKNRKGGVPA